MRILALLLLVSPLLLAGCVDEGTPTLVTARLAFPIAADEARAWDPDALFIGLLAVEPADADRMVAEDGAPTYAESLAFLDDPNAGDGRAQAWMYLFNVPEPEERAFAVIIGHDGRIRDTLHVDASNVEALDLEGVGASAPVAEWKVDSDHAARAAWGHGPFASLAGTRGTTGFISLHHDEVLDTPLWMLALWNKDGDHAAVAVDALSGEMYTEEDLPALFLEPPPFESGRIDGKEVGLLAPRQEDTFVLEHLGHLGLYVGIDRQGGTPLADIRATLIGPDGAEHDMDDASYFVYAGWDQTLVPMPQPGTWTVRVDASTLTVQQAYAIRWCSWDSMDDDPSGGDAFGYENDPCAGGTSSGAATSPFQNVKARFSAFSVS